MLIDTQIPDWDPAFLANYDPAGMIDQVAAAGADGVMAYFQSHVGLCNWPTRSGRQHAAFAGRDPMAQTVAHAHERGLPVCAYYSVNFNNWAWREHPDWRLIPAFSSPFGGGLLVRERYGLCCLNNPDYRDFLLTQTDEITAGYDIDAFFFDMIWWMSVCLCDHCRARARAETGEDIPEVIDWLDPAWCRFQAARERWISELAALLRERVRRARPGLQVYHNFALGLANWGRGVSFSSVAGHDFLGGDFYGGRDEQLVISRLMLNLSPSRPAEFMTTVGANLAEHERLKSTQELTVQTCAAAASAAAFLMIASLDPDGGVNPVVFERISAAFARTAPYQDYLGGEPVEDIAVYCSDASKMSFAENGRSLSEGPLGGNFAYPHLAALQGACRKLQAAHLPFGVITRKQLDELARYRLVVLPNVLRMDEGEVAALRAYVAGGGRLYASQYSSLTLSDGRRGDDFMLADVFGCHFRVLEDGPVIHLKPLDRLKAAGRMPLAGQRFLSHWCDGAARGALRLGEDIEGETLATLSLPYGYPASGSVDGADWASIHSSPPWEHRATPVVVENDFGRGRAIYAAADIEAGDSAAHGALFIALLRRLLDQPSSFEAEAHPAVWMTAFDQPAAGRLVASLLNYQCEPPMIPIENIPFVLRPPAGRRFTGLRLLGEGAAAYRLDDAGALYATARRLDDFLMYVADYEAYS